MCMVWYSVSVVCLCVCVQDLVLQSKCPTVFLFKEWDQESHHVGLGHIGHRSRRTVIEHIIYIYNINK